MRKKTTAEEDVQEAIERVRYDVYTPNTSHAVDPDFDGQEEFHWETIGELSKKIVEKAGQK